ncbi:MAG: hypothetical protein ACPG49_12310, partial [Chitinophagales bacterium]
MICFEAHIDHTAILFLQEKLALFPSFEEANIQIRQVCGILNFFNNQEEMLSLKEQIEEAKSEIAELDRRAYGDFQTNDDLAHQVVKYIAKKGAEPEFVLEPTCGKG